jgi:hypothetical protein
MLGRENGALTLRADPCALAPECLLVFEVRGSVQDFANAVNKIKGLDLVDEEELEGDDDEKPVAYLFVPDERALKNILGLWKQWSRDQPLEAGYTPWRDVFATLRDLRRWGPEDRVQKEDRGFLVEEVEGKNNDEPVKLEVELVFRVSGDQAKKAEAEIRAAVRRNGGRVITQSRIEDIRYHALLIELPVAAVKQIIDGLEGNLAGLNPVMHIRPQSIVTALKVDDTAEMRDSPPGMPAASPILALFDGVPVQAHPFLAGRLDVVDLFGFEPNTPVNERRHGTAMASLITLGDLNRKEDMLPRRIVVVPVLQSGSLDEEFPNDRLIVDMIYQAVRSLRENEDSNGSNVIIANLSLGNTRRPFHGQMSPWARLLDRLAWQYGILFVVSAGNKKEPFSINGFATATAYQDSKADERWKETLLSIDAVKADRRLLSPAETVNGITVGAMNVDSVPAHERSAARTAVDPYPDLRMANPSSRLGPGFARSVKPDVLFPGAREHVVARQVDGELVLQPSEAKRPFGLKVAAPPTLQNPAQPGYTGATSAATALASRTAHRIHDALEDAYGEEFTSLPHRQRAVLLKALLAHPARWDDETTDFLRELLGPADPKLHTRQKDNIRRYLGYGFVDADEAVACATDRATFWVTGEIPSEQRMSIDVPVPSCINGQALPHGLWATLAWFSPVRPGRGLYRAVRLNLLNPEEDQLRDLRVTGSKRQPDTNQARRGTLVSRRWIGNRPPIAGPNTTIRMMVQREPDQGEQFDEALPFGLAVTLTMPGVNEVYDEVRHRLGILQPVRV